MLLVAARGVFRETIGQRTTLGDWSPEGLARDEAVVTTLLVSDLVGSTRLVEQLGDRTAAALFQRHDRLARDLLEENGGREIDKTDGFLHLFDRPWNAVSYALAYHEGLRVIDQLGGVVGNLDLHGLAADRLSGSLEPDGGVAKARSGQAVKRAGPERSCSSKSTA